MIEQATVDAYGEAEQITGWFTMIEENLAKPFEINGARRRQSLSSALTWTAAGRSSRFAGADTRASRLHSWI